MKKMMKHLLAALLCVSAAHATTHSNKTFLMPRAPLRDKAMELSTWHTQINKKGDGLFGGSLQATGFYQSSTNERDTGRYFGADNATTTKDNTIQVVKSASTTEDLFNTDIFHAYNTASSALNFAGTLRLNPRRDVWGVRFDYYQDLDKILNGLFIKASTVVAGVHTSLHEKLEDSIPLAGNFGSNVGKTVTDFFAGNLSQGAGDNQQAALAYAKINGGHNTTDLADIDLNLGYNFVHNKNWHLGLAFTLMIPTGNTPHGEFVFEPVNGHGGSWAVGGILDSAFTVWKSDNKNLRLLLAVDYRFLFENTQRRTVGIIQQGFDLPHGQYVLMGKQGVTGLFPAANITTRDVSVEPGSQVEAIAGLAFNCCNWTFDVGYNLYYQDREAVKVKSWQEATYAVADFAYQTNAPFDIESDSVHGINGSTIIRGATTLADLNVKAAETPSQLSHKLYGGIGYAFNGWSTPLMLGLGGGFEWKDTNSILEQWSVWAKTGVSF